MDDAKYGPYLDLVEKFIQCRVGVARGCGVGTAVGHWERLSLLRALRKVVLVLGKLILSL